MKKIKAVKALVIEEGKHEGQISAVVERSEPFEYVDIVIKLDDSVVELKRGYPMSISDASALGRLLTRFGEKILPDKEYDVEKILMGKDVSFLTINKITEKGTFADIIAESVKPV